MLPGSILKKENIRAFLVRLDVWVRGHQSSMTVPGIGEREGMVVGFPFSKALPCKPSTSPFEVAENWQIQSLNIGRSHSIVTSASFFFRLQVSNHSVFLNHFRTNGVACYICHLTCIDPSVVIASRTSEIFYDLIFSFVHISV